MKHSHQARMTKSRSKPTLCDRKWIFQMRTLPYAIAINLLSKAVQIGLSEPLVLSQVAAETDRN